ncbi:MAG: hypothetical protein OEY59_12690, partial [Deltaproteobacteria bacterium]|nr:hypothetical protein [Deltaproteobacteria bacterium]
MEKQKYTASLSRSKGRNNWCIIFRHPLRSTNDGSPGRRVRRSIGTTDKKEAERLVVQMNVLLSDKSMWKPNSMDIAERKFDKRIVSAFYDNLNPVLLDSRIVREEILPLPTKEDGFHKVLLLGTTGSGKTTIVRQLIGTHPKNERFPSISPSRTTICDIEIILNESPYKAVITFFPKEKVRLYIEECVQNSVMEYIDNKDITKATKRFLEHTDHRFRLSYILGSMNLLSRIANEEDLTDEEEEEINEDEMIEVFVSEEDLEKLSEKLQNYLNRIRIIADYSKNKLTKDLGITEDEISKDWEEFQELLEYQLLRQNNFHELVDEVIDDVESRFQFVDKGALELGRDGWPSHWFFETENRAEFIPTVNRFSSNYARNFGRLLTPLVDGMRISGAFKPEWWGEQEAPKLVLLDGEGLGHTSESASSIPTATTRRYDETDVIILVDNAAQPMQASPLTVMRSLVSSGHESKLITCFTHFDELKGDNLPDTPSKKAHVIYALDGTLTSISKILGRSAENALKKATAERVFFLSNIQKQLSPKARLTKSELGRMIKAIENVANPELFKPATPIYDMANLVLSIQKATQNFHHPWRARLGIQHHPGVNKEHWTRVKALSRRIGVLGEDQYDTLRPVADLIARLAEHLSMFLSTPLKWETANPDEDSKQEAIDKVQRKVFKLLHQFSTDRIFKNK